MSRSEGIRHDRIRGYHSFTASCIGQTSADVRQDRAAQFAPFAALTGHKDAIRETERLTERKRRLSEDCRQILDLYLREVCQSQEPREVDFEYFVPDQKKEGGSYQKKSGCIRRIDTYLNEIVLQSGDRIPLDEIVDIDGVIAAADEV